MSAGCIAQQILGLVAQLLEIRPGGEIGHDDSFASPWSASGRKRSSTDAPQTTWRWTQSFPRTRQRPPALREIISVDRCLSPRTGSRAHSSSLARVANTETSPTRGETRGKGRTVGFETGVRSGVLLRPTDSSRLRAPSGKPRKSVLLGADRAPQPPPAIGSAHDAAGVCAFRATEVRRARPREARANSEAVPARRWCQPLSRQPLADRPTRP